MNELKKRITPRTVILVGLALAAVIVLRRAGFGGGGDSAPEIIDPGVPLGGLPAPGFGEDAFDDESTTPLTIPLPPQGGVIIVPGFDPILYEPPPPPGSTPPPKPAQPSKPKRAKGAWWGGQFWTPNERKEFRAFWERWRRRKKKGAGEGAWEKFLASKPGLAAALGFPVIPRPGNPATIPDPGTAPQSTASSTRDVGAGGQTLAAAPGNRRAVVEAPRIVRPNPGIVRRDPNVEFEKVERLVRRQPAHPRVPSSRISGVRR